MFPKVSIITINLNNAEGLKKTMPSVLSQTYPHLEYIVIDGNSSDASVDEIKKSAERLAYWVSEPDKGLYQAMNKGLGKAKGEYVLYLNSADYFYDDQVIEKLVGASANEDLIYGNLCLAKDNKMEIITSAPVLHYHEKYQHNLPPHPSSLIKRHLIQELGGFDETYKIIADVVLISKLVARKNLKYKFLDIPVTIFDMNGVSSNPDNQGKIYQERLRFIQDAFPAYEDDFLDVYKKPSIFKRLSNRFQLFLKEL